ncbi:MAG: HAD family hydrolase [Clostridia bacterium]|nr:HAD family hydrolase [Clostridia bacterium]
MKRFSSVLFDLDGTLLPMDLKEFTDAYFSLLLGRLAKNGFDAKRAAHAIQSGIVRMVANDGSASNETAFWRAFEQSYGPLQDGDTLIFEAFYREEFPKLKGVCGFDPRAALCVEQARKVAHRVILATNPLFPATATEQRAEWSGCPVSAFDHYTTFENASFSKPNPEYYKEILAKEGLKAEECLMVGNDVDEDMIAATLGMKVFLLTPCLINKKGLPIDDFPHGDFEALLAFLKA